MIRPPVNQSKTIRHSTSFGRLWFLFLNTLGQITGGLIKKRINGLCNLEPRLSRVSRPHQCYQYREERSCDYLIPAGHIDALVIAMRESSHHTPRYTRCGALVARSQRTSVSGKTRQARIWRLLWRTVFPTFCPLSCNGRSVPGKTRQARIRRLWRTVFPTFCPLSCNI